MNNNKHIIMEIENYLECMGASLEIPSNINFGHFATNALMVIQNKSDENKNKIINWFKEKNYITNVNIINNFINFDIIYNVNFINTNIKYDFSDIIGERINLEFSSPNPTGPMHVGHLRGTIIGLTLFNLLKYVNCNVASEMIINDCGRQVNEFYKSVLFYKNEHNQLYYEGEYIKDIANYFKNTPNMKEVLRLQVKENVETLKKLNVEHEIITYESELYCDEAVLKILDPYLYVGRLENQKEDGEMLLLKTSEFGDNQDRVFKNQDYTYFAKDIFYHYDKFKRGFKKQIIVLGEDHIGHLWKLVPVLKKLFNIELKVIIISNVTYKNQKMSKRTGKILTIDEVLLNLDINLLKIKMLERTINKTMDINFTENSLTLFNLYYVMQHQVQKQNLIINESRVSNKQELYRRLLYWPKILKNATKHMDPHMVYNFLSEIINLTKNIIQENYDDEIIIESQKIIKEGCTICSLNYKKEFIE